MRYSLLAVLPALAAASPTFSVETIHKDAAPVLSSTNGKEIPNSYMVVFKKHVKHQHAKDHHEWVQSIHTKSQERMELRKRSFPDSFELFNGLKHTYDIVGGMMGYSGHFDDETLEEIRRHPDVSHSPFLLPISTLHVSATHSSFIPEAPAAAWRSYPARAAAGLGRVLSGRLGAA